jgi:hypothetical protein
MTPLTPSLSPVGEREGVRGFMSGYLNIGHWKLFGIW